MPQLESRVSVGSFTGGGNAVVANQAESGAGPLKSRIADLAYAPRVTGDIDAPDKLSAGGSLCEKLSLRRICPSFSLLPYYSCAFAPCSFIHLPNLRK